MLATIIWLLICGRGLWVWRHNARQAKKNLVSVQSNGPDEQAVMFVRCERAQDNLRALAFSLYIVLGIPALFTQNKAWVLHHLTFVRYYGDFLQAVLVFGVFVFAANGEITRWVQAKILKGIAP